MILAADIGGTKTTLALFDWEQERVEPERERTFVSNDFKNFDDILEEFLRPPHRQDEHQRDSEPVPEVSSGADTEKNGTSAQFFPIQAACFGVAGPVVENRCRTTNLPWSLDGDELAKQWHIPYVRLLNDLEATAYGLLVLRPDEFEVLNPGIPAKANQAIGLVAAGTGLGEAILFWDGVRYHPMPSEGGHADFAPNSDVEIDLLRHLRTQYLHVSYERVLSGSGLHAIYEFLRDTHMQEPTWLSEKLKGTDPPATIAEAGLKKQADIAVKALDLFASVYGAEAGNLALKAMALNGVYLGGGIAPKLLSKLQDGTFMRSFTAKGRYEQLLSSIPVRIIMNPKTALLGAAAVAAQSRKPAAA